MTGRGRAAGRAADALLSLSGWAWPASWPRFARDFLTGMLLGTVTGVVLTAVVFTVTMIGK